MPTKRAHGTRLPRRSRTVLGLLLLASLTLMTLDASSQDASPVEPLRVGAAWVMSPLESAMSSLTRPLTGLRAHFATVNELQAKNAQLSARNARLAARLHARGVERQQVRQLGALLATGRDQNRDIVPAQVVAMGSGQTFSRTVTIDAGTSDGIGPDMTVRNADGLVGRVLRADEHSATVLLIADPESVVGGRLGSSMELGFLRGSGGVGESARLSFDLVDDKAIPVVGDTIVTWGSRHDAPYVPGVPIGKVTAVRSSPRELTTTATVRPFVDFTALDVVGVVAGTSSGRTGSLLSDPTPYEPR